MHHLIRRRRHTEMLRCSAWLQDCHVDQRFALDMRTAQSVAEASADWPTGPPWQKTATTGPTTENSRLDSAHRSSLSSGLMESARLISPKLSLGIVSAMAVVPERSGGRRWRDPEASALAGSDASADLQRSKRLCRLFCLRLLPILELHFTGQRAKAGDAFTALLRWLPVLHLPRLIRAIARRLLHEMPGNTAVLFVQSLCFN